ncbi:DNA-protecting protein DprA [Candidatus Saccharibacteria bacterium]|nr:DNA-protecting protein DprA [Candidatus Saccharibacteria bacterium]
MKINEIRPQEHIFTEKLKTLALIPKMLYFYGKLPVLGENSTKEGAQKGDLAQELTSSLLRKSSERGLERPRTVAIVGSRKNTAYGKEVAYRAAYEAAKAGAVVVSGLAYGIDSIAHRGALDAGGITVAVLGTPITEIYPREHERLAREIIDRGGAVISEYSQSDLPAGKTEIRTRFLARNRIIAGLSDVVVIAEAAARSGSLNTAMHALDIGADLMAVPGDINRLNSEGCNRLLSQGAIPYTGPDALLGLLFPERLARKKSKKKDRESEILKQVSLFAETEVEQKVLMSIMTGLNDGDEIIKKLELPATDFSQAITMLEIKGAIKALGANRWMEV